MKVKVFIHSEIASPGDEPTLKAWPCDMSNYNSGELIEVREIEVNLPSYEELVLKHVAGLQKDLTQKRAEAQQLFNALELQISKFQSLSYSPESEVSK